MYQPECWSAYPQEVRDRYISVLHKDVADGKAGFVSEEFACEVLADDTLYKAKEAELAVIYCRFRTRAVRDYDSFRRLQESTMSDADKSACPWPDFRTEIFDREFEPPKKDKIEQIFDAAYDLVEPYLRRDMLTRLPGPILRWDATFEFAKKLMCDTFAEEKIDCLSVVWGTYGHILRFFSGVC